MVQKVKVSLIYEIIKLVNSYLCNFTINFRLVIINQVVIFCKTNSNIELFLDLNIVKKALKIKQNKKYLMLRIVSNYNKINLKSKLNRKFLIIKVGSHFLSLQFLTWNRNEFIFALINSNIY